MSGSGSRAWIDVDLGALVENARTVARIAGAKLLPVVKANAYGLGAVAVARALEQVDPWGYGVATIEEGAELRAAGITHEWSTRGERAFHVEIDTGMGRAGVRWDEIDELGEAVDTAAFEGCYTQ